MLGIRPNHICDVYRDFLVCVLVFDEVMFAVVFYFLFLLSIYFSIVTQLLPKN